MALKLFEIRGPYNVPLKQGKKHGYIPLGCSSFWTKKNVHLKKAKGCYVFGFRAGKGLRPVYVGKTKRNFGDEAFTSHKIAQHYSPALANTKKGTPIMFFVVAVTKGPPPKIVISDLEKFLIEVGVAKNPDLSNIQNRSEARWGIKGVLRAGKGKASGNEKLFRRIMGI